MADSPKNALPVGHVVDKYRIEGVLGSGGFGIVYRGQHQELGLEVAIKEYLPLEMAVRDGTEVQPISSKSRGGFDEGMRRFLEEAKRLVQFNHPNVVRCRDFFRANGTAYLVMDFEDGLPLSELLQRREDQGNPLSGDEIKRIILPLLDGLAVVHAHDVLHRDIKPSNIFIRRSTEEPVLIDFGAAKQGFSEHSKSVWAYTQGYAPPEQIEQDGELGPWTDIYAVGAVMWRIVVGDNPPKAEDRAIAQARGNPDPMTPAAKLGEDRYPPAMLQAIDKCMSLREKDRHQSAEHLNRALLQTGRHPSLQQKKPAPAAKLFDAPAKSRMISTRKTIAATVGVAATVVLAALLIAYNEVPSSGIAQPTPDVCAGIVSDIESLCIRAKQGDTEAQFLLGVAYVNGEGVPRSAGKAARWYRLAAEQGLPEAQTELAIAYEIGLGVPQSYGEAMHWYRLAAEQGYASAQYYLGAMYDRGRGVPQDRQEACIWYSLAEANGNILAALLMHECRQSAIIR